MRCCKVHEKDRQGMKMQLTAAKSTLYMARSQTTRTARKIADGLKEDMLMMKTQF